MTSVLQSPAGRWRTNKNSAVCLSVPQVSRSALVSASAHAAKHPHPLHSVHTSQLLTCWRIHHIRGIPHIRGMVQCDLWRPAEGHVREGRSPGRDLEESASCSSMASTAAVRASDSGSVGLSFLSAKTSSCSPPPPPPSPSDETPQPSLSHHPSLPAHPSCALARCGWTCWRRKMRQGSGLERRDSVQVRVPAPGAWLLLASGARR